MKTKQKNFKTITISFDIETLKRLDKYCEENLFKRSNVVNMVVKEFLDKQNQNNKNHIQ